MKTSTGSVNPKLLIVLGVVIALALFLKLTNPHKKYSTREFWATATVQTVQEVPADALKLGNKNGGVLMWAAMGSSDPAVIRALVARGADLNEHEPMFSGTPLTSAAGYSKHPAIMNELVKLGADVHGTVNNKQTALMIAAQYNTEPGIVEALVALGADVEGRDAQGHTALELAKINNNKVAELALTGLVRSR